MAIIFRSDAVLTAPLPDTPIRPVANPVFSSDAFTGASGEIVGRLTDATLGGTPKVWRGDVGGWASSPGQLAQTGDPAARFVGVDVPHPDMEIAATLKARPTAGFVQLVARRTNADNMVRALISAEGNLSVQKRVNGTNGTIGGGWGTIAAGDVVALRLVGTTVTVSVNGKSRGTATDATFNASGDYGLATGLNSTGGVVGRVVVRRIDTP